MIGDDAPDAAADVLLEQDERVGEVDELLPRAEGPDRPVLLALVGGLSNAVTRLTVFGDDVRVAVYGARGAQVLGAPAVLLADGAPELRLDGKGLVSWPAV